MSMGIIGKKLGMSQIFDGREVVPVTVIQAGPCKVVQKKTVEKDGYEALQLAFQEEKKQGRVTKAMAVRQSTASWSPVKRPSPPMDEAGSATWSPPPVATGVGSDATAAAAGRSSTMISSPRAGSMPARSMARPRRSSRRSFGMAGST